MLIKATFRAGAGKTHGATKVLSGIAVLAMLSFWLSACQQEKVACSNGVGPYNYAIERYQVQAIEFNDKPTTQVFIEKEPFSLNKAAYDSSRFGLYITSKYRTFLSEHATKPNEIFKLSLFANAYACTPFPAWGTQQVKAISITSDVAFNEARKAGDELNDKFVLSYVNVYPRVHLDKLQSLDHEISVSDYFREPSFAFIEMQLALRDLPSTKRHNFTVSLELADGSRFEMQTGDVLLKLP